MGEEALSSDAHTIFGAALIPISWHVGCDRRLEQTPLGYSQPWMRAYPTVALSLAIPELGRLPSSSLEAFYFFYFLTARTRTSRIMLSRCCLVPDLRGKVFHLLALSMMLTVIYQLEEVPSYSSLVQCFCHEEVLDYVKCFFLKDAFF